MENKYQLFINALNNSDTSLKQNYSNLISILDYKKSVNFCEMIGSDNIYDAEYVINIEQKTFAILGIKILDTTDEELITKTHLYYWNKNDVPFSIIILPNEIRIYNNFSLGDNKIIFSSAVPNIDLELLSAFDNEKIINGVFWERLRTFINKKERVDYSLLENLKSTIIVLHNNYLMQLDTAYNFLAQCIFIKYLEDRKMIGEKAFSKYGSKDFVGLLEIKQLDLIKSFFVYLKERFNGDLFDMNSEDAFPSIEQISLVCSFFKGDEISICGTHQITLFCYDFSIIPIELISNIYETFFNLGDQILNTKYANSNGAYYTPYFLADFMIQKNFASIEALGFKRNAVVLDPACGSGVFLVGAYKKIVEQSIKNGEKITGEILKNILVKNVFGIDINRKALRITCFSLYIALLEYMNPKDIVENQFKFPTLIGTNLFDCSFFDDKLDVLDLHADLIIGNPPWVSDKNGDHITYCQKSNVPISDKQLAQAFIARCKDFASNSTIMSLIVTNSIFTNYNAKNYRTYLFDNFKVVDILNLNRIKNKLFLNANAPCSILTYMISKSRHDDYSFGYFSFKPNLLSEILNKLVYDKTEIMSIKKSVIKKADYIWYVLTYGDEFDVRVVNKLKTHNPLSYIISDNEYQLHCERGYVVGTKNLKFCPKYKEYKGGNLNNCFSKYAINYDNIPYIKDAYYERPRKLELYTYPHKLLIKRTFNKTAWGAAFCSEPIIFTDDFHCIVDKSGENSLVLMYLEALINSKLFYYYCFHTTKLVTGIKPELTKDDLQSFPVPDIKNNYKVVKCISKLVEKLEKRSREQYLIESFDHELIDNLDVIQQLQNQVDDMIYELYNLNDVDKETIEYTFSYSMPNATKKSFIGSFASDENYQEYIDCICSYFNKLINPQGMRIEASKPYIRQLYCMISFEILPIEQTKTVFCSDINMELLKNLPDILGISSLENLNDEMLIKNRISGFIRDGFFVIKTKEIKNWTKMGAIKDANYFTNCVFATRGVE